MGFYADVFFQLEGLLGAPVDVFDLGLYFVDFVLIWQGVSFRVSLGFRIGKITGLAMDKAFFHSYKNFRYSDQDFGPFLPFFKNNFTNSSVNAQSPLDLYRKIMCLIYLNGSFAARPLLKSSLQESSVPK